MPVIAPFHQRRHREQNGFGAAAGLQAEDGAAVDYQVEFDIAAAPVELKIALALAIGYVFAAFQDRHVGGQEMIADALLDRKCGGEIRFAQIVEKDTADAARGAAGFLRKKIL